jgi:Leucine-rich repeat (LRR) protein
LLPTLELIYLDGEDGADFGGSLPSELGRLTALTTLFCRNCHLTGTIPENLWHHPTLAFLGLELNKLVGSIPHSVGESKLVEINVAFNALTGTIPVSIGQLGKQLTLLSLNDNGLHGMIPEEVGQLFALQIFSLGDNALGPQSIPDWLWTLTDLAVLRLSTCKLKGTISTSVANLSLLRVFTVDFNQLSGIIPTDIGALTSIETLFLGSNDFVGSVPSELGFLTSLRQLVTATNGLTGSVPSEFFNLKFASKWSLLRCSMVYCFGLTHHTYSSRHIS